MSFEALRRLVRAPPEERKAEQEEERQKLTEACRTLSLHALGQQSGAGVSAGRRPGQRAGGGEYGGVGGKMS